MNKDFLFVHLLCFKLIVNKGIKKQKMNKRNSPVETLLVIFVISLHKIVQRILLCHHEAMCTKM